MTSTTSTKRINISPRRKTPWPYAYKNLNLSLVQERKNALAVPVRKPSVSKCTVNASQIAKRATKIAYVVNAKTSNQTKR